VHATTQLNADIDAAMAQLPVNRVVALARRDTAKSYVRRAGCGGMRHGGGGRWMIDGRVLSRARVAVTVARRATEMSAGPTRQ